MKVVSLIVALVLALASGAPAQPAQLPVAGSVAEHAVAGAVDTTSAGTNDDDAPAAPGPSTYLLLALGLFGMGLVSRRRQAD